MTDLITYIALTTLSFFCFIVMLFIGLKHKRKKVLVGSFVLLITSIFLSCFTIYTGVNKTWDKVSKTFEPRSGEEIYTALFGPTNNQCVQLLDYRDQIMPKIDGAILLHFKACPKECERILSEFDYSKELSTKVAINNTFLMWETSEMKDSIYQYSYTIIEGKNYRNLWISKDSTEVYCQDIFD